MNSEVLFGAAWLAGFLGSAHCIGMCGAIVVLFEQQGALGSGRWWRRFAYNGGRLGFYALLGAIAGAGGAVITKVAGVGAGLVMLRLIAGAIVVAIGLNLAFDLPATRFLERAGTGIWRRLSPLAAKVLPITSPAHALAAGFIWGALPCGLVYSAVAMAVASGGPGKGAAVMLAFWLGTLPALVLAGASAERLGRWTKTSIFRRGAGAVMIVLGLFALMPVRMLLH